MRCSSLPYYVPFVKITYFSVSLRRKKVNTPEAKPKTIFNFHARTKIKNLQACIFLECVSIREFVQILEDIERKYAHISNSSEKMILIMHLTICDYVNIMDAIKESRYNIRGGDWLTEQAMPPA
jgi:hypothetical protein